SSIATAGVLLRRVSTTSRSTSATLGCMGGDPFLRGLMLQRVGDVLHQLCTFDIGIPRSDRSHESVTRGIVERSGLEGPDGRGHPLSPHPEIQGREFKPE